MALAVFLFTYFFLVGLKLPIVKLDRTGAAIVGAALMVGLGEVKLANIGAAIDGDTLVLLLGMMLLCAYLRRAAFFRASAYYVLRLSRTPRGLLMAVVAVSGVLSAFLVNDTVCLMLTPLVLMLVKHAELPPVPYLFALCMASNAGSAATFTGNPQNMIIGVASHMHYGHFAALMALPALVSMVIVYFTIAWFFRDQLGEKAIHPEGDPPPVNVRLLVICALAMVGIFAAFFAGLPMSWSAFIGAALVMLVAGIPPEKQYKDVDYSLLVFFACLFIVVHGVNEEGWAAKMHELFAPLIKGGPVRESFGFTALSLTASNLFSNVPFVMLARTWVPRMADPELGWQVLALSSTLAGNLTIIGSVANLIVFEGAKKDVKVTFMQYLRVGAPATVLSLVAGLGLLLAERQVLAMFAN